MLKPCPNCFQIFGVPMGYVWQWIQGVILPAMCPLCKGAKVIDPNKKYIRSRRGEYK